MYKNTQDKKFDIYLSNFLNQNKNIIGNKNVKHVMNGAVLSITENKLFDLYSCFCQELKNYCKESGFIIEKIVFVTTYAADVNFSPEYKNINMLSDSLIEIIEEDEKFYARVSMGYRMGVNKI